MSIGLDCAQVYSFVTLFPFFFLKKQRTTY